MAWSPHFVVILAILILPSRLLGQLRETTERKSAPEPAPTATLSFQEVEAHADLCCPAAPWWEDYVCLGNPCASCTPYESIFVFSGLFTRGSMGDTADVFHVTYDHGNYPIALAYQRYHWSTKRFHWGWEVGIAGRFGDDETVEIWGGPTVRHEGITLGRCLRIMPSLTAGFSGVSESHGHERNRERSKKGDASFLFYLGPEIAISTTRHPNIEIFYRLHHRCGGGRTLGDLSEGYNANVFGVRFRF